MYLELGYYHFLRWSCSMLEVSRNTYSEIHSPYKNWAERRAMNKKK